jgi:hypothetical protein
MATRVPADPNLGNPGWDVPETEGTLGGIPVENFERLAHQALVIIIYGPKDGGKTSLAASAAATELGRPVLFLDIEKGMRSIEGMPYIQRVPINTYAEFRKVMQELQQRAVGTVPWRTIVVDNFSWVQEVNLQMHTQGWTIIPEFSNGIWSRTKNDMISNIRMIHDVAHKHNVNIIVNCWHEDVKVNKDTDRTRAVLDFTPGVYKVLPGLVDFVGYLDKDERDPEGTARVLSFQSVPSANSNRMRRSPHDALAQQLPEIIYRPSLASIIDLLRGGIPWPTEAHALPPHIRTRHTNASALPTTPTEPQPNATTPQQ